MLKKALPSCRQYQQKKLQDKEIKKKYGKQCIISMDVLMENVNF